MDDLASSFTSLVVVPKPRNPGKITWPKGPSIKQKWPFRDSLIHYIATTPPSARFYRKLVQTCKYFFETNPLLLVTKFESGEDGVVSTLCSKAYLRCFNNEQKCCIKVDPDKLASKIWLIHEIDFVSGLPYAKIYRSGIYFLEFSNQAFKYDEFKFLASTAKVITLYNNSITYNNGDFVMLDEILQCFLKVDRFEFESDTSVVNAATLKNIMEFDNLKKLERFHLRKIPDSVNVQDLSAFIKEEVNSSNSDFAAVFDMSEWHRSALNSTIMNAHSNFTMNILRETGMNSSTIFSPISLTFALAMIYFGANGETAAQIRNTIGKGIDEEEIHFHFASILSYIKENNINGGGVPEEDREEQDKNPDIIRWKEYNVFCLEFVNQIFVQQNFEIEESYKKDIQNYYQGGIEKVDFNESDLAVKKINDFVANITDNKLQNLVNSFDPLTELVLINAIYFEAEWELYIDRRDSYDTKFYSTKNESKEIKMMKLHEEELPYFENDEYQIVGIPYKNCQLTMYLILPREQFSLEKVIANFDASNLARTKISTVSVHFPRFKIESDFDIVKILQKLGITEAFTENANFSGISKTDLLVSEITHKAMIETNEDGSIAVASGSTIFIDHCFIVSSLVYEVIADHPFMFIIADEKFNFIFAGTHF